MLVVSFSLILNGLLATIARNVAVPTTILSKPRTAIALLNSSMMKDYYPIRSFGEQTVFKRFIVRFVSNLYSK